MPKLKVYKGGPGSGHHGHDGIPGKQGGSLPGSGRSTLSGAAYAKQLDEDTKRAFREYGSYSYKEINNHFRKGEELSQTYQDDVELIDKALADAPPLTNASLYRALAKSPEEVGLKIGDVFTDNGYTSTSSSSSVIYTKYPNLRTKVTLKLSPEVRESLRGIPINGLVTKQYAGEKEVLLQRGLNYRITNIAQSGPNWKVTAEVLLDE